MKVMAIHRDPFSISPRLYPAPEGETLAEMASRVKSLPEGWPRHEGDAICINGEVVPRGAWHLIRPHAVSASGSPVEVTFHAPPMGGGGGGGGGKNVLSVVASIGLIALSGGLAAGFQSFALANLTRSVTTAALLGKLAGAAVLIGGSAILQALAPTPSIPRAANAGTPDRREVGSASAQGNVLEPNAPLPRVVGTRKVFPPFVAEPFIYFEGQDEVVEAVCALAGPHKMEDLRVAGTPVADIQGLETETREGWPGLDPLTLVRRYARTFADGSPIRGQTVDEEDKTVLATTSGDILDALPQPRTFTTRDAPDEVWIGLEFPSGLSRTGSQTELDDLMRVAFRVRIRRKGDETWRNFPEVHFMDAVLGPRRANIKLVWRDAPVNFSTAATRGWVGARLSTSQGVLPTSPGWDADAYFESGPGAQAYLDSTNTDTTEIGNVFLGETDAQFVLDRAEFPPGIYEVEVSRGYAFRDAEYTISTNVLDGLPRDTLWYEGTGTPSIHQTKNNLVDQVSLVRHSSIWNAPPVTSGDVALIAMRARNIRADRLSVLASGYVRDWDGTGWTEWKTTSDPAPHLRDVLAGLLNATPLPPQTIDDASLVAFRTAGWTCDAIMEGTSVADAARVLAGSGFAQLYQSETVGVIRDRDRSADAPVQVFTPHNSANFSWSRGFPKLPDGFRASYIDASRDYEARQIIHPPGAGRTEQVSIEGLVTEADVRARLQYDLDTAKYRSAFYSWDAAADAIKCRRGSLVAVVSDALAARVFSGRVSDFDLDASGDVIAVQIDNDADLTAEPAWADIDDLTEVQNMALIGAVFGLAIRRKGKTATTHQVAQSARGAGWVDLATAATLPDLDYGDLAAIGPLGSEYRRLIVTDMRPVSLTDWTIIAVPEAPELWQ
jgi:hypothetical protein